MLASTIALFEKQERWLLLSFFLLFAAITVPGITWGTPSVWNNDELVFRVNAALINHDYGFFDQNNFDYPSLPKYVIYGIGSIVYTLGGSTTTYIVASRLLSVTLGGLVVVLTYLIAKRAGATLLTRVFATLLTLFASEIVANAHYAHNDLYLLFFVTLSVYLLLRYQVSLVPKWLYWSFATAGLAASSKYNGIFIVFAPLLVFALAQQRPFYQDRRRTLQTYCIGGLLTAAGYVLGTPRAALSPVFYFQNVWPAFLRHRVWGRAVDSGTGLVGQWDVMKHTFGSPIFIMFVAAFVWALYEVTIAKANAQRRNGPIVLVVCVVVFNMPFWFSYNYQPRFFLPFVPLLSVLTALLLQRICKLAQYQRVASSVLISVCVPLVAYCILRVVSVDLLFLHDSRIEAGQFLASLPHDEKVGYGGRYSLGMDISESRQIGPYPDTFVIFRPDGQARRQPAPDEITSEAGFIQRGINYYVVDSFTTDSVLVPFVCRNNPSECDFITRVRAGRSHYTLLKTFAYGLPGYLPHMDVTFVNPTIRIYKYDEAGAEIATADEPQEWQGWELETRSGSVADLEYPKDEPKRLRVSITRLVGRVPWSIQITEVSFSAIANHEYVLTFRTRADARRKIACAMGRNAPPWNTVGLYREVDVTTDWETFQSPFVATSTESNARIFFDLGNSDAAVELADVVLHDVSTGRDVLPN